MSEQDNIPSDTQEPSEEEVLASLGEPEEADEGEESVEEFEEVDWDEGKKVKVTKGFKDALLREKDYRHKTHEIGEERRKVESERASFAEERKMAAALDDERAELRSIDKRLAEYDKVTPEQWAAWRDQDERAVSDAQFAEAQLRKQREKLLGSMREKYETLTAKEKEKVSAWEAEQSKATKERVPDWSESKAKTVAEHVGAKFGLKASDLEKVKDAGIIALLNHVYTQDKAIEAAKAKAKAARQEREPEPAPVGKVNGGKAGAPRGPNQQTLKSNPAAFDSAISKMIYGGP